MRFRTLFRKAFVSAVAVLAAFVAINVANVASAAPEHCSAWIFLKKGGTVKICASVEGRVVKGRAILSGRQLSDKMTISIYDPINGVPHGERAKQLTISEKMAPGTYRVDFTEEYGYFANYSPNVTVK